MRKLIPLMLLLAGALWAVALNVVDLVSPADLTHLAKDAVYALKVDDAALSPADVDKLSKWVQAGHCLIVYDCKVAARLGFHAQPVAPGNAQSTTTQFGKDARPVAVMDAMSTGRHPAVQGLTSVTVAALLYPDNTVSAVAPDSSCTPLLTTVDQKAALAAVRPLGKGKIVFKPFVITNPAGVQFNQQLDDWMATGKN
jgi:hypothetical protein